MLIGILKIRFINCWCLSDYIQYDCKILKIILIKILIVQFDKKNDAIENHSIYWLFLSYFISLFEFG